MATVTIGTDTFDCAECRCEISEDTYYEYDGFCEGCYRDRYPVCSECGNETYFGDYRHDMNMCDHCYWDKYNECHDCGERYERNLASDRLCPNCRANPFACKVSGTAWHGISWDDWAEFARATRDVDYGCKFDCKSECSGTRNGAWHGSDGRGCCRDCGDSRGYLDKLPPGSVDEVTALYDEELGFWRPGGCTLPVEYRSHICLTYRCGTKAQMRNADSMGLDIIDNHSKVLGCKANVEHYKQRVESATPEQKKDAELSLYDAEATLARRLEEREKILQKQRNRKKQAEEAKRYHAVHAETTRQLLESQQYSQLGIDTTQAETEYYMVYETFRRRVEREESFPPAVEAWPKRRGVPDPSIYPLFSCYKRELAKLA